MTDESSSPVDGLTRDQRAVAIEAARVAAAAFAATGWTWGVRDGKKVKPYVPDQQAIEKHLISMLSQVVNDDQDREFNLSSGRFRVTREHDAPHLIFGIDLDLGSIWEGDDA